MLGLIVLFTMLTGGLFRFEVDSTWDLELRHSFTFMGIHYRCFKKYIRILIVIKFTTISIIFKNNI